MNFTLQTNPLYIPLFNAFTAFTPVIPKEYWNVYSQEQLIKGIAEMLDKVCAYANELGITLNYTIQEIENLTAEWDKWREGAYDEYYQEILNKWVEDHMPDIIAQAIKMVFFGLTDDGYFCAYIPDSWYDIEFDTGYNESDPDTYMHLILKY